MFSNSTFCFRKRIVLCALIVFYLSGCEMEAPNHHAIYPATPISNTHVAITPASLGASIHLTLSRGLIIDSASGFICHFNKQGSGSPTPGTLVLSNIRQTYDQGTLQSLKNYLNVVGAGFIGGKPDTVPYPPFSANPDAFQLSNVNISSIGCLETFQFTNNGSTSLQISQISLQFMRDIQTNTQHYNLIDACSLSLNFLSQGCPPTLGALEPSYVAQFDLRSGKAKIIQPATCWGYDDSSGCSPQSLTLQPGDFAKVTLKYFSNSPNNYSFSLQPLIKLNWSNQQTISYSIPQIGVNFSFASISQFSCYALQGEKFTQVPLDNSHWCI